jgi:3-deoxy-manno-octulosonate cytidylyltransferase (CMP-KDO synthetase)
MKVCAVIPARLASTRLPRKILADIHGKPLLWYVWCQVEKVKGINEIFVATDSDEVVSIVEGWGGKALLTSKQCRSGTERIASVLDHLDGEFILNVQADEPLIDPRMLETIVTATDEIEADIITSVFQITQMEDLFNSNLVKVARALDGRALYFSRSPIPFVRDIQQDHWLEQLTFWGHVGVYGYKRDALAVYPSLPASPLETAERLEQLRFLEAGFRIETIETAYHPIGVDTPADLKRVRRLLKDMS